MGQNIESASINRKLPSKQAASQKNNIPFSQLPKKATFNYLNPLKLQEDNIESFISDSQFDLISDHNYGSSNQLLQTLSNFKSIKQIKVKWNSFIKMKQKNYLQDYQVVKNVIGRGGFGIVRKVKSKYTQELRVAKVVRKKLMKDEDITKLFTELYIMKMLDHPNIIKLYEVYDYGDQFALLIQMCTGGQVYSKTKKKKIPQKKAAMIIKQVLRSLIYMHNQKIVHRDIKPQNMLFQNQQRKVVKLIDFGIAKKFTVNQFLQQRIGTPTYISPQIIYKKYNQKCDIWATGVSMYQFICGRPPFVGENDSDLMRQILRETVSFQGSSWQKISDDCKAIIKMMLTRKVEERPSAKQLFEHKFFASIQQSTPICQASGKNQVIKNIHGFRFKNRLQAVVQTFIASQLLTKQQKQALVEVFKQFDSNSDGVISVEELRQALTNKNKMSDSKVESMMRVIDINGSGQIDYTQFLVANCDSSIQLTKKRLKQVFQYFDTDHNGCISYDQVTQFLEDYESSQDQIKKMFQMVDQNGDGSISEDQFISLLMRKATQFTEIGDIKEQSQTNKQNKTNNQKQNIIIKKRGKLLKCKKQDRDKARKISFSGINELIEERIPLKSKFTNQISKS